MFVTSVKFIVTGVITHVTGLKAMARGIKTFVTVGNEAVTFKKDNYIVRNIMVTRIDTVDGAVIGISELLIKTVCRRVDGFFV